MRFLELITNIIYAKRVSLKEEVLKKNGSLTARVQFYKYPTLVDMKWFIFVASQESFISFYIFFLLFKLINNYCKHEPFLILLQICNSKTIRNLN